MPWTSIGNQELALLQYLSEHEPATVADVVSGFGVPRQLARSTVLTMMERLRSKGHLKRRKYRSGYRYRTATAPREAVRNAVGQFVQNTLRGSVSPFVAWMAERGEVDDAELAELEALVATLQSRREEP